MTLRQFVMRERTLRYQPGSVALMLGVSMVLSYGTNALGWAHVVYRIAALGGLVVAGMSFAAIDFEAARGDRVNEPIAPVLLSVGVIAVCVWWLW